MQIEWPSAHDYAIAHIDIRKFQICVSSVITSHTWHFNVVWWPFGSLTTCQSQLKVFGCVVLWPVSHSWGHLDVWCYDLSVTLLAFGCVLLWPVSQSKDIWMCGVMTCQSQLRAFGCVVLWPVSHNWGHLDVWCYDLSVTIEGIWMCGVMTCQSQLRSFGCVVLWPVSHNWGHLDVWCRDLLEFSVYGVLNFHSRFEEFWCVVSFTFRHSWGHLGVCLSVTVKGIWMYDMSWHVSYSWEYNIFVLNSLISHNLGQWPLGKKV